MEASFECSSPFTIDLVPFDIASAQDTNERSPTAKELVSIFLDNRNHMFVRLTKLYRKGRVETDFYNKKEMDKLVPLLLKLLDCYGDFDEEMVFDIVKEFKSLKEVAKCLSQMHDGPKDVYSDFNYE